MRAHLFCVGAKIVIQMRIAETEESCEIHFSAAGLSRKRLDLAAGSGEQEHRVGVVNSIRPILKLKGGVIGLNSPAELGIRECSAQRGIGVNQAPRNGTGEEGLERGEVGVGGER